MQIRKIKKSEDAVVGIVVAVLLIGLMVSVISLLQLVYVPNWMEQKEAEHMDQVATQFAQLKFVIDTQSAIKQKNMPIATSITLGSKELPFLMSARSFGQLEISERACKINVTNNTGGKFNYSIGIIKYSSANAYFVNQEFIYETGAIITNQNQGNMMSIKPSFSASINSSDIININFTLVNISGVGGKISSGGYDTTAIQTEFYNTSDVIRYQNVKFLNISTSYPNAWQIFLNSSLKKNFIYNTDFIIYTNNNQVSVKFTNPTSVTVDLKIINILAQIGPGWIE